MKEKNWEEKGGQVVNAITRAGSQIEAIPMNKSRNRVGDYY